MNDTRRAPGTLFVVGLGPGSPGLLTPDAASAIESADVVVGYRGYLDLIAERLGNKMVIGRELGEEVERARAAIALAEEGKTVALVSSGDAGIYGMGGVASELASERATAIEIVMVPGVTAACSAAARLGAPLAHDWACISLSDLLTPWEIILRRVESAARGDFVLVLYNPRSRTRTHQLGAVAERLLNSRTPDTPVGLVENAYRAGERVALVTLRDLALGTPAATMFTTVIIGSSQTYVRGERMITPRIYAAKAKAEGDATSAKEVPAARDPGEAIMAESLAIIDREMGPEPADPGERAVVRRMIHASADFDFARSFRASRGAIEAMARALRRLRLDDAESSASTTIVTDVEMLRAGIRRDLAEPLGLTTACFLTDPETRAIAAERGLTRSAAGVKLAAALVGNRTVVAIGNAPTAVEEALRLIREESWSPAGIIGIPVGFVGVEAAKRRLVEECEASGVPYITCLGRKGGTAVTAAAVNALLELAAAKTP